MIHKMLFSVLILQSGLFLYTQSLTNWLPILENSSNKSSKDPCKTPSVVNNNQRQLCNKSPTSLIFVAAGLQMSLAECQHQFIGERWNCSKESFIAFSKKGTKESAFIYSVTSASVTHTITRACSSGNMTTCSCAKVGKKRKKRAKQEVEPWPHEWEWGGCSDNIRYGLSFSRQFAESRRRKTDTNSMVNLHNNKVGRKLVAQKMKTTCRCHGVSGACEVRTCWRALSSFASIGEELKKLYDNSAIRVTKKRRNKLRPTDRSKRSIRGHKLVYIEKSPDFCVKHPSLGINGVRGRVCNRTSTGVDSCRSLCCGRGYNTRVVYEKEMCYCKFHWCCSVSCKTCVHTKKLHTCK